MTVLNQHNANLISRLNRPLVVCSLLIILPVIIYGQMSDHAFVNFDDEIYYKNPHVQQGFTAEGIEWAFSMAPKQHATYWHPVTWLSFMLGYELFGYHPGYHLLGNLVVHVLNSLLMFLCLNRMTRSFKRSMMAAALFALHPMNVESVAWFTQRTNLLSMFFGLLAMLSYVRYAKRRTLAGYMVALAAFSLSLMAKPMLITIPFVLLLLDVWPLQRINLDALPVGFKKASVPNILQDGPSPPTGSQSHVPVWHLLIEKMPFMALAALSIYVTVLSRGIIVSTQSVPMDLRFSNALVAYVQYIGKLLLPLNLCVYYPFPPMIPLWKIIGAILFLLSVTIVALRKIRTHPYLLTGWLWFLGTLVPVIGLVQSGLQPAIADRYAYFSFIGLFIIICWGIPAVITVGRNRNILFILAGITTVAILSIISFNQVKTWKNSYTLFNHAFRTVGENPVIQNNLAVALVDLGNPEMAVSHFSAVIRATPDQPGGYSNLGNALSQMGRYREAVQYCEAALKRDPDHAEAHNNMGFALTNLGKVESAVYHFNKAIALNENNEKAYNNLGVINVQRGEWNEASRLFERALTINYLNAEAHNNLGVVHAHHQRLFKAIGHFKIALRIKPNYQDAQRNLKMTQAKMTTIKSTHEK
jgi:Tfp pilus assembly protein PilF